MTDIQREILRRLCDGETMKEVGAAMGASPKTIANHVLRLRQKHGCKTTVELCVKFDRERREK